MLPIPIGTDRPQRRFPWMNILLIAANVLLFIFSRGSGNGLGLAAGWDKYMLYPPHPQLHQFITYQFLHANLLHIASNMLFLYVFGNALNEKLGHVAYLTFYLAGGVLAGCGHALTSGSATLGASGSISAVTGMFLVLLPRTHVRLFVWLFMYADVWEIPSLYFILFKVGQDIIEPLLGASSVAHMAHLSGYAAGFAIGLLLLGTKLVQRDHYDLLAMLNRWKRRKSYETMVAGGFDPYAGTKPAAARKGASIDPRVTALREEVLEMLRQRRLPDAARKYVELRAADATQVLAMQDQLDVANQLMSEQKYAEAAGAYEDYLRVYPTGTQTDQVMLILGIVYAKYRPDAARAVTLLRGAVERLHDKGQRELAEAELTRLTGGSSPPAGA